MADVIAAYGTEILVEDKDGSGGYTAIPHIGDIDGPGLVRNIIEWRSHSSAGGYTERVPGGRDTEPISFSMGLEDGDVAQEALRAAYEGDEAVGFQIQFPDGTGYSFNGLVSSFKFGAPVEDVLTADVEITIDGPLTELGS